MPITIYPGSMKKRNANGSYSDLVPAIATDPEVLDDFAEEYSTSETYNIGDYCIHNSDLYKCNTNNTTGTWNNNAWDRVTVGDELVDHENALNQLETNIGKILPVITGSTNNSGYTIAVGDYFEANGTLYQNTSSAAIPIGGTWSGTAQSGTAINGLNGKFTKYDTTIFQVTGGLLPLNIAQTQNILFVQAQYVVPSQAIAAGDWVTLGILPEGHRPSGTIYTGGVFADGTGEVYGFRCNVTTNGAMSALFKKAISTSTALFGTMPIILV